MALKGIDISAWQGSVDFAKVKADGVKFAILRDGYRKTIDTRFVEYVRGCQNAGIPILGTYHFIYWNGATIAENAASMIKNVQSAGLDPTKIWLFADLEYDSWTKAGESVTKAKCSKYIKQFLDCLVSAGCKKVGIYCNQDYYRNYLDWNVLKDYREHLWLADYEGEPGYSCSIQQTGSTGKVNGISGNVDMDTLFDESMLNKTSNSNSNTVKKSNEELAQEVLQGKWGNGEARRQALTNAGYSYSAVQSIVNRLVAERDAKKKSNEELAQEVLQGKWGNGEARRQALTNAGYDYSAVQAIVNRLVAERDAKKKSNEELAQEVLQGKWGNGEARRQALTSAGYDYSAVQAIVNRLVAERDAKPAPSTPTAPTTKPEETKMSLRDAYIKQAQAWLGLSEPNGHKVIIDCYNRNLAEARKYWPACRNIKMGYTDPWHWCSCFVSSVAMKVSEDLGSPECMKIVPIEIACTSHRALAQSAGIFIEDESVMPEVGWLVLYDWQDSGSGDNRGSEDHIGLVETVNPANGTFTTIEGNSGGYTASNGEYLGKVVRKTLQRNQRYIRGFIAPKWGNTVVSAPSTNTEVKPATEPATTNKVVKATGYAYSFDKSRAGSYITTDDLNLRNGAGTSNSIMVTMPKGTKVRNYGYYTNVNGTDWYFVVAVVNGVEYHGHCSGKYLKRN